VEPFSPRAREEGWPPGVAATLSTYAALGLQPLLADDVERTVAAMVLHAATQLPEDFLRALRFGWERESNDLARSIYRSLLDNAAQAAAAGRPTCQDTGQAVLFAELGQDLHVLGGDLEAAIQRGVAAGYRSLRASIVRDALFDRRNTGDNTPAIVHLRVVPGRRLTLHLAEKGFGSENKSFLTMYPYPQGGEDAVVAFVLEQVRHAGAGWCPPGVLSVAVGYNFETAPLMAKRALFDEFDMDLLLARAAAAPESLDPAERLRVRLFREVNALQLGPQGLGGLTTVLDVKLRTGPTHIAGLPIAVNLQCNKAHHLSVTLDGAGPRLHFPRADAAAYRLPPGREPAPARRVQLPLDDETRRSLRAGDRLLLNGRLLTARDAAHRRMVDALARDEPLPVSLAGELIYYVGPIEPVAGEVVGPAGPTTASRMDPYTAPLLQRAGLAGAIGKGERGPEAVRDFVAAGAVYLIAIGGAGYLQSRTVTATELLAYPDLGPEAIRSFEVRDFPVVVAIDTLGSNLHDPDGRGRAAAPPPALEEIP